MSTAFLFSSIHKRYYGVLRNLVQYYALVYCVRCNTMEDITLLDDLLEVLRLTSFCK